MKYDHILIRYGELALKGKNRSFFEQTLLENIRLSLKEFPKIKIKRTYGIIVIELNNEPVELIKQKLQKIFGVYSFSLALKTENNVESIQQGALTALKDHEKPIRTFKVNARRAYKDFPTDSQTLNHLVGGYVLKNTENIKVDVHNPDLEIKVEVRESATYITCGKNLGPGGLPVGTSGRVMLMLSGGIDSPVAGYLTMKRGVRLEAIHFHSPPFTNERAKQKVKDLVKILAEYGGLIRLHLVPFTEIQKLIKDEIVTNYQMTVMRRMMLRISERIALNNEALAIATGESLGQVASQTLHSMNTINEVTNLPIIRPLVTMDKLEVIELAQKIGTYETSILPFEDCCTIFLPPESKTKPRRDQAQKFESYIDFESYINEAIAQTEIVKISTSSPRDKAIEDLF